MRQSNVGVDAVAWTKEMRQRHLDGSCKRVLPRPLVNLGTQLVRKLHFERPHVLFILARPPFQPYLRPDDAHVERVGDGLAQNWHQRPQVRPDVANGKKPLNKHHRSSGNPDRRGPALNNG